MWHTFITFFPTIYATHMQPTCERHNYSLPKHQSTLVNWNYFPNPIFSFITTLSISVRKVLSHFAKCLVKLIKITIHTIKFESDSIYLGKYLHFLATLSFNLSEQHSTCMYACCQIHCVSPNNRTLCAERLHCMCMRSHRFTVTVYMYACTRGTT